MRFVVFALVFALFVAIFALQNSSTVTVSLLFWSFQTSLVLIILGSATLGALTILSLAVPVQFRLRRSADKAIRHGAEMEARVIALEERIQQQEKEKEMSTNDIQS